MKSTLVAQTLLHSLRPVGSQAERDHGLLRDTLRRELGPDAADFFAEPVPSQDGSRIDWYVPARSRPEAASSLSQEDRHALLAAFEARRAAIEGLAVRLDAGSQGDREAAKALRHALQMPSGDALYRVDGRPAVVGWGFVDVGRPDYASGLKATAAAAFRAAPPPPAPPPPALGTGPRPAAAVLAPSVPAAAVSPASMLAPLLWLLFAALLLALVWALLALCFLPRPAWLANSPALPACGAPTAAAASGMARIAILRTELDGLERQAIEANALCAAQAAPTPAAPAATPAAPAVPAVPAVAADIERRLDQSGAQGGALQISLIWDGPADLDLSVICPGNARLDYRAPARCGGRLDTDANSNGVAPNPVENIFWADAAPPQIPVDVTFYGDRGERRESVPFQLRVRRTVPDPATGEPRITDEIIEGVARRAEAGAPQRVTTIGEP